MIHDFKWTLHLLQIWSISREIEENTSSGKKRGDDTSSIQFIIQIEMVSHHYSPMFPSRLPLRQVTAGLK